MTAWKNPAQQSDSLASQLLQKQPGDDGAGVGTNPAASHVAWLQGQKVAYELRRSARRSLGLEVNPQGLLVRAPRRMSTARIAAGLNDKAGWILTKLHEVRAQAQQERRRRIIWRDGVQLPWLGGVMTIRLDARVGRRPVLETGISPEPSLLRLPLPPEVTADQVARATRRWLQGQARRLYTQRLDHYAPLLAVHWRSLKLSSARTRWGSASSTGDIRLHWQLMHCGLDLIDYVVVHELAHLLEMNHGPRFWAHVARILPDYRQRRQRLQQTRLPIWPD